ncbi:hypothetical protein AcW1_006193 [Taiwanofungus camphoratus]|nr:hypothetical protein AcW1_006193 [Antrodia cinnamomea]
MAIETIVTNRGLHVHHSNEPRNRGHRFQGDTEVQDYAVHRLLHLLRDPHDAVRRPWNVRLDELPNHEGINGDNCSQDRFMIYHSGQVLPREDPRRPIYPGWELARCTQPGFFKEIHRYNSGHHRSLAARSEDAHVYAGTRLGASNSLQSPVSYAALTCSLVSACQNRRR